MISRIFSAFIIFCISLLSSTIAENQVEVLSGISKFTNKIYDILSKQEGNIIFSPFSIHAALSMIYQGSAGSTYNSLSNVLQIPEAEETAEGYESIINHINAIENVTLLTSNKIYIKNQNKLLKNFEHAVTTKFSSEVEMVDFFKNIETADIINNWIKNKTNNKIVKLINSKDINGLTNLVLLNVIYFKGNWAHKFDLIKEKQPFYIDDKNTVNVEMMHVNQAFNLKNDKKLEAEILELPYKNQNISMVIVLPFRKTNLKYLENKLINIDLASLTENMWNHNVDVYLPKFKIEQKLDLQDTLETIGLGEIFDQSKANFTRMLESSSGNLFVGKAVHKAFLEVNEEGTEAAAATGFGIVTISEPPQFLADRPFIFLIQLKNEDGRKEILFQGRILNPK